MLPGGRLRIFRIFGLCRFFRNIFDAVKELMNKNYIRRRNRLAVLDTRPVDHVAKVAFDPIPHVCEFGR